jgi:hypothetical protein
MRPTTPRSMTGRHSWTAHPQRLATLIDLSRLGLAEGITAPADTKTAS